MPKMSFSFVFVLILSMGSYAQNQDSIAVRFNSIQNSTTADSLKVVQIKSLITKSPAASDSLLGAMYHRLGLLHYRLKEFENALSTTQKAIVFRESPGQDATLKHNSQYNLSFYYNSLGQTTKRIAVLNQLISDQNPDRFTYKSLVELGYYYSDLGDYYKSLQSFEMVVNSSQIDQDKSTMALGYMGLIYVTSLMQADELKTLPYNNYIDQVQKLKDFVTPLQLASLNTNIGRLFETLDELSESKKFYLKALQFYKTANQPEMTAILLNNLGSVRAKLTNKNAAIDLFLEGLQISSNPQTRAVLYDNLGYYSAATDYKKAQFYFEKAIGAALDQKEHSIFVMPSYDGIAAVSNKSNLLRILTDYAQFLYDHKHQFKEIEVLELTKELVLRADFLITLIRDESQIEQSKLFWIGRGVNVYMLGVRISYQLNDASTAFYFMEKNKALLLLENIQRLHSKENLKIPKQLLERQRSLQSTLAKSAQKSINEVTTQERAKYVSDFALYNTFMDSLKVAFPSYVGRGRFLEIKNLQEVTAQYVNESSAVVTYIMDESFGFGIFIDDIGTVFFKFNDSVKTNQEILKITALCEAPFIQNSQRDQFWKESHQLFGNIFPIDSIAKRLAKKRLVVVPDYTLQQLPFEVLITSPLPQEKGAMPYLIKNTTIAYLHSFSVDSMIDVSQKKSSKSTLLAVAPKKFYSDSLVSLERSSAELAYLKGFFKTTELVNKKALKSALISNLGDYSLIHFSTHAGYAAKNRQPWLALYDSIITLEELYAIPTKAQLVTLGACQTAEGRYVKGEGTLSLSRAFFITGSRSVLASLWNANEKSNGLIMKQFYKNLKEGDTKDRALQKAKLSYLMASQLSETSPYYWANLTITGQLDPINSSPGFSYLFWLSALILLVLTGVFILKKTRPTV